MRERKIKARMNRADVRLVNMLFAISSRKGLIVVS